MIDEMVASTNRLRVLGEPDPLPEKERTVNHERDLKLTLDFEKQRSRAVKRTFTEVGPMSVGVGVAVGTGAGTAPPGEGIGWCVVDVEGMRTPFFLSLFLSLSSADHFFTTRPS